MKPHSPYIHPQGSWYGSWAVCFTYGTWFGVTGLAALGSDYANDEALRRSCEFLLQKQQPDGGWGESYLSCQDKVRAAYRNQSEINASDGHCATRCMMHLAPACIVELCIAERFFHTCEATR